MTKIIAGDPVMVPSWKQCPKCKSNKVIVEEVGHYSEVFQYGVVTEKNIHFAKLGPTVTTCVDCDYEEEEDVN